MFVGPDSLEARVLAGAADRDVVDERFVRIDARLHSIDARFDQVDNGFIEMHGKLDATASATPVYCT